LFEDELDYVWHALRRLGVREADLDDEVNEVFLRVHRQFAKYDPSRPVRPWLFAFAARVAAEHRRLAHNRREVPGLPPDLLDPGPSTEAQAADNEARAMVLRALDRLDQSKREVFVAIELGGHSAPELALELGVPVNTVYSRLRLARDEFAAALEQGGFPVSQRSVGGLPPDVQDALDAERARPGMDGSARARARARLHASLLSGMNDHTGGHSEPHGARERRLWPRLRSANPVLTAVLGFGLGLGTGLAVQTRVPASHAGDVQRELSSRSAPKPEGKAPVDVAPRTVPQRSVSSDSGTDDLRGTARDASAAASASPREPGASTLVGERALLDVAHSALGNGHADDALVALARHAERYPNGVYREEREALTIQCLHALGRTGEAARKAAVFRARYPKSLFLPSVTDSP
jgi:RNA polymerase sigma-70 factor (ECF subfamily)